MHLKKASTIEGSPVPFRRAQRRPQRSTKGLPLTGLGFTLNPKQGMKQCHLEAELLDLLHKERRALVVNLARHQPRRKLHDVDLAAEVVRGLGGLEAEEAPSQDHAALVVLGVLDDVVEVLDGAVAEDAFGEERLQRGRLCLVGTLGVRA